MSSLELKGGILELVSKIDDEQTLQELKELIFSFIGQHQTDLDFMDELPLLIRDELKIALAESYDEQNLVDHETVMAKFKK